MKEKSFVKSTFILGAAGILSKVLGAIYRIPLARQVGREGIGIYQMAYPFYMVILALSTAGIPLAVSKLVSERVVHEDRRGINRIIRTSTILLTLIGGVFAVALFAASEFIALHILKDPRALWSIRAITPAILLTSIMSTLRGYFQGFQDMRPTAYSQVAEQLLRVITVFLSSYLLIKYGIEYAVAGANFGASVGGLGALTLLIILWYRDKKAQEPYEITAEPVMETKEEKRALAKEVLRLAIPISLGALVLPLMQIVDLSIVPGRLQAAGYTMEEATGMYGQLSGMAGALINLPFILTTAIAASLVPAIAENREKGNYAEGNRQFGAGLLLAIVFILPAAFGLLCLAVPISTMLYAEPSAGGILSWLAPTVIAIGLYQVSAGALQGSGLPLEPMKSFFLGITVKAVFTFYWTGMHFANVRGAALATLVGFTFAATRNMIILSKHIGTEWYSPEKHIWRPGAATLIMTAALLLSRAFWRFLPSNITINTVLTIAIAVLVYGIALIHLGGIDREELAKLPHIGTKAIRLLEKFKIIKD